MIKAMKNLNLLQNNAVVGSQTAKNKHNQNSSIKCETESIKSCLCDYSHAFILVTGNIAVNRVNDTTLNLKIVHHFLREKQKLMMYLLMKQIIFTLQCLLYNLNEYNDNYSDTSRGL